MAFEYTPYRNPYIGTIADLMARGEDAKAKALIDVASAQARAAEAKGQIYGNAISSIGQQIGNIPAQMQANKEQAFKADQQARMVREQQREDAAENEFNRMVGSKNVLGGTFGPMSEPVVTPGVAGTDMEPDTPETRTLPSRAYMPTVTNPFKELSVKGVNGLDKWDVEKASQQFASMGLGVQGQKYLELMRGSNDDMDKHHASAMDLVRKSAARALQAGSFDMMLGSTNALMSQLANNKVIGREDLSAFQQQLDGLSALPPDQKETALRGLLRNISGVPEEEYTLNLGDVRYQGGKPIAANPRPLEKPETYQVTVPGPDGKPMSRLATAEEMAAGVPVYREPKAPAEPRAPTEISLAIAAAAGDVNAKAALQVLREQRASASGGGVDSRNKQAAARSDAAKGFLERLNQLRVKINTKMGPAAGLTGLARQGAASIGLDPDVAEYERIRSAAGRVLAVAIMGAQNLSDADAKSWSDILPGSTVDEETAKRLTDQVGKMLDGMTESIGQPPPFENKELGGGITAVPTLPPQLKKDEGVTFRKGPFAGQTWKLGSDGKPVKVS